MNKIALCVGHDWRSQGAVNLKYGKTEWAFNDDLVYDILSQLANGGFGYDLHFQAFERNTNAMFPIRDVVKRINAWGPDLAIEFHCNSFDKKTSGTEMLVSAVHNTPDKEIGGTLYHHVAHLGLFVSESIGMEFPWRGVKFRTRWQRGGYFLNKTNCKAIIAESFFIDNDHDYEKAIDNYDNLVQAYVDWIIEYVK